MNIIFPTITPEFYVASLPVTILGLGSIVAMLQSVFKPVGKEQHVFGVLAVTMIIALAGAIWGTPAAETSYLGGAYLAGELSRFGQTTILVIATAIMLVFRDTFLRSRFFRGEIASLFLMVVCGMMVMVSSEDLISLFVGLELSSIGLYAIVGYTNPSRRSQEGAIKYFVLGSFAAAMLLFGFALLYTATGTLRLSELAEALPKLADHSWVKLGTLFTVVGLGFKLALAPFHLWAPDTYEAAPTGITALMATSIKVMILVLAIRLFAGSLSPLYEVWMPALMFVAVLSMILGNIMALVQTSLKRMLAYSSIAHSGYMAIAVCAIGGTAADFPVAAILYYLVGYSIISVGAFSVLMWLENDDNDNLQLDDITGLAKAHPWAAFALTVFMFSFAGMPPTVGFISKFFVFNAALSQQLTSLVVIGVIGSSISVFYYLRVVVRMYMSEPVKTPVALAPNRSFVIMGVLGITLVANLLLGTVLPGPVLGALTHASQEVSMKAAKTRNAATVLKTQQPLSSAH